VSAADELGRVPLFASLDDAQRLELAAGFSVKTAEAGSHLIGEGSHGYSFFVLLEGTADVTSSGATIAQLAPGDFFGEIAIVAGGRRTASVTTTSHARLLVLSADEFRRLADAHPAIAAQIERAMRERTDQPRDRPAR
jgi:CPA2 family monovalent cation:H+ antiporter-2